MNLFSITMDSFKESMQLSARNIKIFIPSIVSLVINVIAVLIFIAILIWFMVVSNFPELSDTDFISVLRATLPLSISGLIIFGIAIPTVYTMIEAGILGMLKAVIQTGNASAADFFNGLKKYWLPIFVGLGIVGIILLVLLLSILPVALVILAGVLTLGWAFLFAGLLINIYFGVWAAILVADDIGAWQAIKQGYSFGNRFFWPLIIIFLASVLITNYILNLAGSIPFVGLLGIPVAASILSTYFKLVVMKFYLTVRPDNSLSQTV